MKDARAGSRTASTTASAPPAAARPDRDHDRAYQFLYPEEPQQRPCHDQLVQHLAVADPKAPYRSGEGEVEPGAAGDAQRQYDQPAGGAALGEQHGGQAEVAEPEGEEQAEHHGQRRNVAGRPPNRTACRRDSEEHPTPAAAWPASPENRKIASGPLDWAAPGRAARRGVGERPGAHGRRDLDHRADDRRRRHVLADFLGGDEEGEDEDVAAEVEETEQVGGEVRQGPPDVLGRADTPGGAQRRQDPHDEERGSGPEDGRDRHVDGGVAEGEPVQQPHVDRAGADQQETGGRVRERLGPGRGSASDEDPRRLVPLLQQAGHEDQEEGELRFRGKHRPIRGYATAAAAISTAKRPPCIRATTGGDTDPAAASLVR